jgi:hypothetical protein
MSIILYSGSLALWSRDANGRNATLIVWRFWEDKIDLIGSSNEGSDWASWSPGVWAAIWAQVRSRCCFIRGRLRGGNCDRVEGWCGGRDCWLGFLRFLVARIFCIQGTPSKWPGGRPPVNADWGVRWKLLTVLSSMRFVAFITLGWSPAVRRRVTKLLAIETLLNRSFRFVSFPLYIQWHNFVVL